MLEPVGGDNLMLQLPFLDLQVLPHMMQRLHAISQQLCVCAERMCAQHEV